MLYLWRITTKRENMKKSLPISKLAKLLGAPRKTFSDWDNGSDYKKLIIEIFQVLGEDEINILIEKLKKTKGINIYTKEDLIARFVSLFPKIETVSNEYDLPKNTKDLLLLNHKLDKNKKMMLLFLNRLPSFKVFISKMEEHYREFSYQGITLEITVFTEQSHEYLERERECRDINPLREINPLTNKPYIPEYLIFKNLRRDLKIDDKAIIL